MNKKAFATYYVIFFLIVIMLFAFIYRLKVSNFSHNISREGEKIIAKELCDYAISLSENIIYLNYAKGNYEFYKSLKFPVKIKTSTGESLIESINILDNIKITGKSMKYEFKDINIKENGEDIGKYDIFKVCVKGRSRKKVDVEGFSYIKVYKYEVLK